MKGKVWLIGAGPGDAGLLTQKAHAALQQADVIVYDALVSLEILCQLPAAARKIHVGKRSGHHTLPQEEINRLLVEEAEKGNRVARLKGGDPFVFGRGGEELELLIQRQIPFEVIPGISSATAVPAYAGIPVTHRQYTSSFHVITGHARKGGEDRIDYQALAKMEATLIFLMGVKELPQIANHLIEAGMDPSTPAAIIENGTTYRQRQLLSTIDLLPQQAQTKEFEAPSIIVVGAVAALMEDFSWRQSLPLFGKICVVTRAKERASGMSQKLREQGAHVLELPAIQTETVQESLPQLIQIIEDIRQHTSEENWLVLSSPSDVDAFFQLLSESPFDLRSFSQYTKWAVVGKITAQALQERGIKADYMPASYYGQSLANGLQAEVGPAGRVFVLKGDLASDQVYQAMKARGIFCQELVVYQTISGMDSSFIDQLWDLLGSPAAYVTFTSGSCVDGFIRALGADRDFSGVQALCIGEKTAEKAAKAGMQVIIAEVPTMNHMIEKLQEL